WATPARSGAPTARPYSASTRVWVRVGPTRPTVCSLMNSESNEASPMPKNAAQKLIKSHLIESEITPGTPIGLRTDQTLTQDATGTLDSAQIPTPPRASLSEHNKAIAERG